MKDFGNIIYRPETKAYVIRNNTYTVPHPDDETIPAIIHAEFDSLYAEIDAYAKANPDKVTEEFLESIEPTLDELKTEKLKEINDAYDNVVSSLVSDYPSSEILTFDKQEQEALAWSSDENADTPLIDALAKGRGINKEELVSRILKKSDVFSVTIGYLTGLRQKYEDELKLAQTKEEIDSIIPTYENQKN